MLENTALSVKKIKLFGLLFFIVVFTNENMMEINILLHV